MASSKLITYDVTSFSPAHITGFFKILNDCSAGAGFTLKHGMATCVKSGVWSLGSRSNTSIFINGEKTNDAVVSKKVVAAYKKYIHKKTIIVVTHKPHFPIGYGLGMSAAGALSLSLALDKLTGAYGSKGAIRVAHDAEIACGTGLGGVRAESMGGFLFRETGTGAVKRIDMPAYDVAIGFLSPIKTKSIIRSREWKKTINRTGTECLASFVEMPNIERFLKLSRLFAFATGLATGKVLRVMEQNRNCSMAMLGNTVFSIAKNKREMGEAVESFRQNDVKTIIASKLSARKGR